MYIMLSSSRDRIILATVWSMPVCVFSVCCILYSTQGTRLDGRATACVCGDASSIPTGALEV